MTNKSINNEDEVDLIDVISIIWKKKWTIILLTSILLIVTFIYGFLLKDKNYKTVATTEIRGITLYENQKYEVYNNIINSIKPDYNQIIEKKIDSEYRIAEGKYFNKYNIEYAKYFEYVKINKINKKFLLNLFLDQLINHKTNIKNALVDSGLFKNEDYSTEFELESKLDEFTSKILLSHSAVNDENARIYLTAEINSDQLENWEKFLQYFEKSTNEAIREKLIEIFEDYTNYISLINKYVIEDINGLLETNDDQYLIKKLNEEKSILLTNIYTKRINEIFNDSPISKPDKFYAAKIIYDSTKYEHDIFSSKKLYILIAIIGLILSTFLVLFSNALKNRK